METLSPVRSSLVRYLAVFVLSAAAVLVQVSPAHAQAGGPFGVPCDSTGVNGIPYVPGVNCRLMAVDGYTREVHRVGTARRRACRFAGRVHAPWSEWRRRTVPAHLRLAGKGHAGKLHRHFPDGGRTFRSGDTALLDALEQLRPSDGDRPESAAGGLSSDVSLARRRREVHPSNRWRRHPTALDRPAPRVRGWILERRRHVCADRSRGLGSHRGSGVSQLRLAPGARNARRLPQPVGILYARHQGR